MDDIREQYKKQISRMLKDPMGREEIGNALGRQIMFEEDLKTKTTVAVLIPSYKGLNPKMQDSSTRMIRYAQQFCTAFPEPVRGSSLISWVRNDMLAELYKSGKTFTHVLWIDDDMEPQKDSLVKMLKHEKDVVGCIYVQRTDPPIPNLHEINLKTGMAKRVLKWKEDGLKCSTDPDMTLALGTGLLLISKPVLDRLARFYIDCEYEQRLWNLTEEQIKPIRESREFSFKESRNGFWFQLLPRMCGYAESGEDSSFCIKAAMCGFKVYVDTTIRPGHVGEYTYKYDDFLAYQDQEIVRSKGNYAELE